MCARTSTYLRWDDAGRRHEIAQAEGIEQGDPLAPGLYALGQHDSLVAASASLRRDSSGACGTAASRCHRRGRARCRCRSEPGQDTSLQRSRWGRTTRHSRPRPRRVVRRLPPARRGFVALGVPIGHPDFVGAHAAGRLEDEAGLLQKQQRLPDLQSAWLLLAYCAAPRAQHLLRNVPPADLLPYARAHDAAIWNVVEGLLGGQGPDEGDDGRRMACCPCGRFLAAELRGPWPACSRAGSRASRRGFACEPQHLPRTGSLRQAGMLDRLGTLVPVAQAVRSSTENSGSGAFENACCCQP